MFLVKFLVGDEVPYSRNSQPQNHGFPYNFTVAVTESKLRQRRRRELEYLANGWHLRVQHELGKVLRHDIRLSLGLAQRHQLLTLKVWVTRYHVTLNFVLTVLLNHYKFLRRRYGSRHNLGISMPVLCGQRSREILEEAIERHFPSGENVQAWNARQRRLILAMPKPWRGTDNVTEYLEHYQQWIQRNQQQYKNQIARLGARPWRGNPWRT